MTKGILGKKVGMTQVFTDNGELVPVTVIDVTPNVVMQVKTLEMTVTVPFNSGLTTSAKF